MILVIFRDFSNFLEINEKKKKIIYNEKRIFFFCAEILKGYCPVCIVREKEFFFFFIAIQFCIAENEACRCLGCIAIGRRLYCKKGCWRAVLQYSVLYCNRLQG